MNKAVLFDFGGTLDTNGIHWSEKFWEVYERIDLPVSKEQYEKAYVYSEGKVQSRIKTSDDFEKVLYNQVALQVEYLSNKMLLNNIMKDDLMHFVLKQCMTDVNKSVKEAKKILKDLKPKYFLGVVSNFYGNLECVLNGLSIREYFDVVIDSYSAGVKKPDPQIFKIALDHINVKPENSVVVGDSYDRDIQPAKALGCKTIWLDGQSWRLPENTDDADRIIHSLSADLVNVIEKIV